MADPRVHVTFTARRRYSEASDLARRAIVNSAVRQAQTLLEQGRRDEALSTLYAPIVVRAATHLARKGAL